MFAMTYIPEFKKNCEIAGFKSVRIGSIEGFLKMASSEETADVKVQFFDADVVATWRHLYFSLLDALTAFKNRENLSRSVAMETMLYASGRRQIQRAMQLLGIKPKVSNVALLAIGEKSATVHSVLGRVSKRIDGLPDDSVLSLSNWKVAKIKKAFEISEEELDAVIEGEDLEKALVDLVIERAALLITCR